MLQFDGLGRFCNISHFISTRPGGASQGEYASFNLGAWCGDDPEAVQQHRRVLCKLTGMRHDRLLVPFQTHGCKAAVIDASFLSRSQQEQEACLHGIDALITNQPDVTVAVSTADCVPLLLYAPDKGIVAAIHAGWRGTVQQIAGKTVSLIIRDFHCDPHQLIAGIGPSISPEAFEVGEEVGEAFHEAGIDLSEISYRHPQSGKRHINLWEANRLQLLSVGLLPAHIEVAGICTFNHPNLFFSARRQGINSGRMLTGIGIREYPLHSIHTQTSSNR